MAKQAPREIVLTTAEFEHLEKLVLLGVCAMHGIKLKEKPS